MQVPEALRLEEGGLRGRIVVEDGGLIHLAELQANALPVFQIDGREEDHISLARRVLRS